MINLEPSQNLEKGDNSFTIDGVIYTVLADSEVRHSQPVNDLLIIALPLIDEKNGVEMERLLRKALEFEPDQADLAFYLALALDLQNRREEATAVLKNLVKQHPDFLLARIELAAMALKKGLRINARAWLEPISQGGILRGSEFQPLCRVQIELLIQELSLTSARAWVDVLEKFDSGNRSVPGYRIFLAGYTYMMKDELGFDVK